jgi:hypothetical protein
MSKYHMAAESLAGPTVEREPPAAAEPTAEDARRIGKQIGIDWDSAGFPVEEFAAGLVVEREHGPGGPAGGVADISAGDPLVEGKIAWAHLMELPDYYTRLSRMESEGKAGRSGGDGESGPAD